MINNRQQNGRRRGRGGPRPQGMEGRPSGGNNRPETRSRGNAPQLHEKYKAMARDAQMAGDRVQTEYYLQFADHYYRILNENRPRFEDRPQQGNDQGHSYSADEYDDEDGGEETSGDEGLDNGRNGAQNGGRDARDDGDEAPQRQQPRARDNGYEREARPQRDARPQREARPEREAGREDRPQRTQPTRNAEGEGRVERPRRDAQTERNDQAERDQQPDRDVSEAAEPVRAERPRRTRSPANGADRPQAAPRSTREDAENDGPGIDFDRLPPAIARPDPEPEAAANDASDDDRPRPVRRPRRPRESTPVAA